MYFKEKINKNCKMNAFVMVESLVAIALILLTIPAALTVVTRSITLGSVARDQMIASYLAQEGLEVLRNRRDRNLIEEINDSTGINWMEGFARPGGGGGVTHCDDPNIGCRIDGADFTITECSGACSNPTEAFFRLNIVQTGHPTLPAGLYTHQSGASIAPTKFYRKVVTPRGPGGPGATQVTVRSTVVWDGRFGQRQITVNEILRPWYQ